MKYIKTPSPETGKKSIKPRYFEQYFCASFLLSSVIFISAFTFVKMNAHMIITTFSHDKIKKAEHINFDLVIYCSRNTTWNALQSLVFTSDASASASTIIVIAPWKQTWCGHKLKRKHKDENLSVFVCLICAATCENEILLRHNTNTGIFTTRG